MKKIINLTFIWILFVFALDVKAQIDPYSTENVDYLKAKFLFYDNIVEATVVSVQIDNVNGNIVNKIQLKIHRDYKDAFSGENVQVYIMIDDKLKSEITGKSVKSNLSHGDRIQMNPVSGISGHFFLTNIEKEESDNWFIGKWYGYPNRELYDLIKTYKGDDKSTDVYFYNNLYHQYGLLISPFRWGDLESLYSFLGNVDIVPQKVYTPISVIYYAPPNPLTPVISIDSISNLDKIRGEEKQRKAEKKN
jgi:hypothetical protein